MAQNADVVSGSGPAISRTGGEAAASEKPTTSATQSGQEMVVPVYAMIQAMLKILTFVERSFVSQAGKSNDAFADVQLALTKMIGHELDLPVKEVFNTIMVNGSGGSSALGTECS